MKSKHFERKVPKSLVIAYLITAISVVSIISIICMLSSLGILEQDTSDCIIVSLFFLFMSFSLLVLFFPTFDFYIKIENELIHIEFSEEKKYTFNRNDFAMEKISFPRRILIKYHDKFVLDIPYNEDVEQFLQELTS